MPLPSITLPPELPPWRVEGYEASPESLYGHAQMSTGHSRTRQLFTIANRAERATLKLTDAQLVIFNDWHEGDLQAGLLPFAAYIPAFGLGMVWFDTLLLKYVTDPASNGKTLVTCDLYLRGRASLTGPGA